MCSVKASLYTSQSEAEELKGNWCAPLVAVLCLGVRNKGKEQKTLLSISHLSLRYSLEIKAQISLGMALFAGEKLGLRDPFENIVCKS